MKKLKRFIGKYIYSNVLLCLYIEGEALITETSFKHRFAWLWVIRIFTIKIKFKVLHAMLPEQAQKITGLKKYWSNPDNKVVKF